MSCTHTYFEPYAINAFVYCARRWWYQSVQKIHITSDALEIGTYDHSHHWQHTIKRKEIYFVSHQLRLKGKCDYVIEENGMQIPLEIKKGHCTDDRPYLNDIMQLIGYILLLEEYFKLQYPYGYVLYKGSKQKYCVEVTLQLRKKFMDVLNKMRSVYANKSIPNRTSEKFKCSKCSLHDYCFIGG